MNVAFSSDNNYAPYLSLIHILGPAAITMAHRYNLDNRDHGKAQRMPLLNGKNGVWSCTFVGYCSEVCPKHVDPASAINQGKVESAKDYVISMLKPKG